MSSDPSAPLSRPALRVVEEGDIAWLILDRPDRRNALTQAMWRALPALLDQIADFPARVLVIRGEGGHFAAGADIGEFEEVYADRSSAERYFSEIAAAMDALADFGKPVLAMIDGACVGGGLGLALCCDLRIAATGARFGITPAKLGLMYNLADTRRLVAAVGEQRARDILYTARILDADEALACGLVLETHPSEDLESAVRAKAASIAAASPWSIRRTKQVIGRIGAGQAGDDDETRGWMADAVEGEDFHEGRAAFLGKRPPVFGR